jgi:hypothetical protein
MNGKDFFGSGFLDRDPSSYGAQRSLQTGKIRNGWRTSVGLTIAVAAVGIATMINVPMRTDAMTLHAPIYGGVSTSTLKAGITLPDFQQNSWDQYLEGIQISGSFSGEHIDFVRNFVLHLRREIDPDFPLPHAGPTPDGNFQLVWDRGIHHLDVDVYSDGMFEWFYTNRETKEFFGNENCLSGSMPAEFSQCLRYIISKNNNIPMNES